MTTFLDAMHSLIGITDDARITRWSPRKRYGDPATVIHMIKEDHDVLP